ncbi:AAA family ATPase [Marinifilum sp.]|uniref:AAA family ATPase n=1 Tax=Marinifilum sp. TaxID=2033137 RepID=UPI003BA9B74A
MTIINRFIITGGPGSGKSSLLNALKNQGYKGFEEISRIIIREQQEINGDKLPWKNLADFAEICYERMLKQLDDYNSRSYCFYDRGIPDIIAYVRRGGLQVPSKYFENCNQYHPSVFITPPWQQIFINDAERPESFKDSMEIYQYLKNTYKELGFQIIELPKASIKKRVEFIEAYLSSCKD